MLINSLTALLTYTSLISPLEVSIILLITAYIVYIFTPKQHPDLINSARLEATKDAGIYMYLHLSWLGKQPLARAFLPFFILFNAALFYADYRADNGTYTIASWLTILVILALPVLWWTISVWRCSVYAPTVWAIMARFITITVYYEYLLRIIIGYYYPQIWFNCQQLIIEFGDCF